jgi:23S rRNA (adenine2503-C2)-methyltransferase
MHLGKKDIKNFTPEELRKELKRISEPSYRAEQIFYWIYKKGVFDFEAMKNLPEALREKLAQNYSIGTVRLYERLKSNDGTEKFIFELEDKNFIEGVLIPAGKRKTMCVSTQVGCKYACLFCASGLNGFKRDLTASEILSQILYLQHKLNHRITNFVFMGMGEPLDNYENVARVIKIMNSPKASGIAARRITVSTCGIIPGVERFKELGLQANLSISLHASNNTLRNRLMPVNKKYPLDELIRACEKYITKSGRMITLEYILLKDTNDNQVDIAGLASIAKRLNAKVNIIPYSPIAKIDFTAPTKSDIRIFKDSLVRKGIKVTVRESKGKDIMAACGQLAGSITT